MCDFADPWKMNCNHRLDYSLFTSSVISSSQESSEFARIYNGLLPIPEKRNSSNERKVPVGVSLPDTVDWREKGVVTPIKNQVSCSIYHVSLHGSPSQ